MQQIEISKQKPKNEAGINERLDTHVGPDTQSNWKFKGSAYMESQMDLESDVEINP